MCLMCEYYLDTCRERECVEAARLRREAELVKDKRSMGLMEEYYKNRSGNEYFLWKGYSGGPCEHIRSAHGPECNVVKRTETEYGLLFDLCNCESNDDVGWSYY